MKIKYVDWNPNAKSMGLVETANGIIKEFEADGYTLTLRQLYYQFVANGIVANTERSYKNLGNIVTKARLAGLISWRAIEDRGRSHNSYWTEEDITVPVANMPYYIRFDRWARQDTYVEVWVEKEALANVVERACSKYYVPHLACKGYLSASEAWRAGRRIKRKLDEGKRALIIHLGDHDPSGLDMTRDNQNRINMFSEDNDVYVKRIALNMDQIDKYDPPPNPTKLSDSRARDYIRDYGRNSWELDSLKPSVLEDIITKEIEAKIDPDLWNSVLEEEKEIKAKLESVYDHWEEIQEII